MKTLTNKNRKAINLSLICLFGSFVILILGSMLYETNFQKILFFVGISLLSYGFVLLYLFFSKPKINFWKVNMLFSFGLLVWCIPMTWLIMRLSKSVGYIFGLSLMVFGLSVSIFPFWVEKKSIEVR